MPGLFSVHRKPDADLPPIRLAFRLPVENSGQADEIDSPPQGLGVVAAVEMALRDVVERHLLGAHKAVHSQRRGLYAKFARQRVERHFKRKANAGPSYSAIRKDRRLIGCD